MSVERILVVDDEEPIREVVCTMLQNASFRCEQACSGVEALRILQNDNDFQLVLTDLMMPEMDGVGLLERVKQQYKDLPVVMVTAVHDISVALAAIRNGAYDYLLKPFEREQLLAVVRRALEANRLRVENRIYQSSLETLVDQRTTELRETIAELERSYDVTLEALGDALDLKDAETEGHSKRVTAYTIQIARAMGLDPQAIHILARGAFLHDIGKMAIPDAILRKPNKLNEEEKAIMKEHSYLGYRMLKKNSISLRSGRDRLCPPGTLGWKRISAWTEGRGDSTGSANLRRCRYPGRHYLGPPIPRRAQRGSRCQRDCRLVGPAVRSLCGRRFPLDSHRHMGESAPGNQL